MPRKSMLLTLQAYCPAGRSQQTARGSPDRALMLAPAFVTTISMTTMNSR